VPLADQAAAALERMSRQGWRRPTPKRQAMKVPRRPSTRTAASNGPVKNGYNWTGADSWAEYGNTCIAPLTGAGAGPANNAEAVCNGD
jgi:hypothetical protein